MSLAHRLWLGNEDLASDALASGFVTGISDGTLAEESFRYYIGQDAFFLESFARAYALALAKSPDRAGLSDFASLISGVLEELELHAGYAERWGVDLTDISPAPATLAYTDFLLSTASLKDTGETCAAMTPCMRLYAYLGQSLSGWEIPEDNPYREWIETYADPDFEVLAVKLEGLLTRYAEETPDVEGVYRRAMELEVAFFEAAFAFGRR